MLTVIIEDCDLHDAGPAELYFAVFVSREERNLEEELLIRLPLVVVHDGNLVHSLVVLALHGAPVDGLDLHFTFPDRLPVNHGRARASSTEQ